MNIMNICDAGKEYPDLDLYELVRQITVFLRPYSFVQSAHLYHGANKGKYHIIFKVPTVPEGQDKTELKSSSTPFFSLPDERKDQEKPQKAPETAAELYETFFEIIEGPIEFGPLRLDEVYRRGKTNPEPFGSPGYYDWPGSEWAWSIANENNEVGLVLPGKPVILYEKPNTEENITVQQEQLEPEQFIRALSVSYENDEEIRIKIHGQRSKTYSHALLGFKRANVRTWRTLLDILQSPDHLYHLGVAHGAGRVRNKSYDANRRILEEINKKFVAFFNKTFNVELSNSFRIFELIKNGPSGTYRFKFTVADFGNDNTQYGDLSRDELIEKIEKLSSHWASLKTKGDEDSEKETFKVEDKLRSAAMNAVKKGWLTRKQMKNYLNPPKED